MKLAPRLLKNCVAACDSEVGKALQVLLLTAHGLAWGIDDELPDFDAKGSPARYVGFLGVGADPDFWTDGESDGARAAPPERPPDREPLEHP